MNMEQSSKQAERRVSVSGDGAGSSGRFRLEPPGRRIQVPQLLIAVLVVAVSALAALVLFSRATARDPVLALATDVDRGQVVASEDLRVVFVGSDDPIASIPADGLSSLVGSAAVADLEEGTIVTSAHFVSRTGLADGEGVVGLALSPGEYPTVTLSPGDLVDVIRVGSGSDEAGLMVSAAEVFDVAELGTQGQRFVSLRMPTDDAGQVAQLAAEGRVRLVLVSGEGR